MTEQPPEMPEVPPRGRLCVVYNTCGLGGADNSGQYIDSLESILKQEFTDFRVVVSDCGSPPHVRDKIRGHFAERISYAFIDDVLPVLVTFNWSVLQAVKTYGRFDGYVYVDSGISFKPHTDILSKLTRRFMEREGQTGMVTVAVDCDNSSYASINRPEPFGGGEVPIGEHINLHCLLVSERFRQAYDDKCLPDVFAGWGSEGAYPYLCSALRMKYLLTVDTPLVTHLPGLDGAMRGLPTGWNYGLFRRSTTIQGIAREGASLGFGFEEFFNLNHAGDRSKFDEQGLALTNELYQFLRERLFLSRTEMDYETVNARFIK